MTTLKKIAIQGYPGAFHDLAARLHFEPEDIEVVSSDTFEDVIQYVEQGDESQIGIIAIENSIAGSLLSNYSLIHQSKVQISGEIYLRIKQNLLVVPGTLIDDIVEVRSHYMAIAQCKRFFKAYPHIKLVETPDTALSARTISSQKAQKVGAIASVRAAELYDLDVLAPSIETNKQNYTRFFILENKEYYTVHPDFNKVSISFSLSHEVGSLYATLKILHDYGANLSKIQSAPIPSKPWEYLFFVDFILMDNTAYNRLMELLSLEVSQLKVLGRYLKGRHHEN